MTEGYGRGGQRRLVGRVLAFQMPGLCPSCCDSGGVSGVAPLAWRVISVPMRRGSSIVAKVQFASPWSTGALFFT